MTTITTDMLRYIAHTLGTTPEYMINVIMRSCLDVTIDDTPVDDTEKDTEEQEAAMQDDLVERVARAMAAAAGLDWDGKAKNTEYANHGYWLPVARAAIAAAREIDAEALRGAFDTGQIVGSVTEAADWLQQRANDVKGCGNG